MALGETGRNPFVPRSTAEGACALRAIGAHEPDPAVRCPDHLAEGFLVGLNITTLARYGMGRRWLAWMLSRRLPGAYAYEIMRAKFIDEVVLAEAAAGLDELVLLGAGLDSRPYRLAEHLHSVQVFEVDHPASLASKRARLGRLMAQSDRVAFVGVDFTRDGLDAALAAAGHDRSARTLFVWSGVSPYLPEEAVSAVLSWIGRHSDSRTSIVFDVAWAGAVDDSREYFGAAKLRKALARAGEPLRWGVSEGRLNETLACFGLEPERVLNDEQGRIAYLKRSNGTLHDRPYGFGVLVHARTSRLSERA